MPSLLFDVQKYPSDDKPSDIAFTPVGTEKIHKDFLSFKSDVEVFLLTINALYAKNSSSWSLYFEQLFNLAKLGLAGSKEDLIIARSSFEQLKSDVLIRSWSKIRDKMLIRYGIAVVGFCVLLELSRQFVLSIDFAPYVFCIYGSLLSSWVSLAIRVKEISFEDISHQLSDFGSPIMRCVFVLLLTLICLSLFTSEVIALKIGGLTTEDLTNNMSKYFALGALFGLSEKYLASKMNEKSKNYIK